MTPPATLGRSPAAEFSSMAAEGDRGSLTATTVVGEAAGREQQDPPLRSSRAGDGEGVLEGEGMPKPQSTSLKEGDRERQGPAVGDGDPEAEKSRRSREVGIEGPSSEESGSTGHNGFDEEGEPTARSRGACSGEAIWSARRGGKRGRMGRRICGRRARIGHRREAVDASAKVATGGGALSHGLL